MSVVKRINHIVQFKLVAVILITSISISSPAQEFILTTTKENIISSKALLDLPGLSGNRNAIIIATPLGNTKAANPHPTGAWYYSGKWNIFNCNHAPLIVGLTYKVQFFLKPGPHQFLHLVTRQNLGAEGSYIDNDALNKNPNVQFTVFQNHSPEVRQGSSLNQFEVKTGYSTDAGKWYITNVTGQQLFPGAAYNIVISSAGNIVQGPVRDNPDILIKDPKITNPEGIIIPDINKPIDKKNPKGIIIPDAGKPLDNKDVLLKKIIPPKYDFSKVQVCIEEITNKSLPPKTPVIPKPVIPKINSNGVLQPVTTVTQPLSVATSLMWSQGESISVGFLPGETWTVINKVKKYAKEWETHANIKFVFVNDVSQATIKVGFKKDGTSWSWMGRDALVNLYEGKTMNLGWLDDQTPESEFRRVVLHEFGHVLGFIHEHQSPNAGIPWDTAKVYSFYGGEPNKWSHEKVDIQVFQKYSATITNSSAYDKFSIMHYSFPAALTIDSSSVPNNTDLSATDKSFAGQVYPFPLPQATSTGVLQTGDDCDEIEFKVEYNVVNSNEIAFFLEPGKDKNNTILIWWKKIGIPVIGNGEVGIEIQDGYSATKKVLANLIDKTRGIAFGKAKILGVHTGLPFTWNVWPAITGGCRVTFVWRRDSCKQ